MDASTLIPFAVASLAILVIPGPAVTYIVTRSLQGGRRVGLASVAGIPLGTAVHALAAVAGLSALLVSSALAFNVVKYGGGLYLIYLGIRALRSRADEAVSLARPAAGAGRALRDGVIVNVLNPKTAIFFLAYLPQFVRAGNGPVAVQLLVLGAIFIVIGILTDGAYALAAAETSRRLGARAWLRRRDQAAGVVYIGLGLLTLASPGRRAA